MAEYQDSPFHYNQTRTWITSRYHDGWVYAAREQDTPRVKIGITKNSTPFSRLDSLYSQYKRVFEALGAVHVTSNLLEVEYTLACLLRPQQIEREWFALDMDYQTLYRVVSDSARLVNERPTITRHETPRPTCRVDKGYIPKNTPLVREPQSKGNVKVYLYRSFKVESFTLITYQ